MMMIEYKYMNCAQEKKTSLEIPRSVNNSYENEINELQWEKRADIRRKVVLAANRRWLNDYRRSHVRPRTIRNAIGCAHRVIQV